MQLFIDKKAEVYFKIPNSAICISSYLNGEYFDTTKHAKLQHEHDEQFVSFGTQTTLSTVTTLWPIIESVHILILDRYLKAVTNHEAQLVLCIFILSCLYLRYLQNVFHPTSAKGYKINTYYSIEQHTLSIYFAAHEIGRYFRLIYDGELVQTSIVTSPFFLCSSVNSSISLYTFCSKACVDFPLLLPPPPLKKKIIYIFIHSTFNTNGGLHYAVWL